MISLHGTESHLADSEYLNLEKNVFILLYLILVVLFSLVPILSLCWFAIRFCLDERSWERDIERYNQVRIHQFVRAARSVDVKVKQSILHENNIEKQHRDETTPIDLHRLK